MPAWYEITTCSLWPCINTLSAEAYAGELHECHDIYAQNRA